MAKAMFTLYWTGFCSISKVALVLCGREYVNRCVVLHKLLRFKTVHNTSSIRSRSHLYPSCYSLKLTNTRFRSNFYSNKSVQIRSGPFQKPIGCRATVHPQQWSRAVPLKNCSRTSISSPIHNLQCSVILPDIG